jgi:hypothetical protein
MIGGVRMAPLRIGGGIGTELDAFEESEKQCCTSSASSAI